MSGREQPALVVWQDISLLSLVSGLMHWPRRVSAVAEGTRCNEIPDMNVLFPTWSPEVEYSVEKLNAWESEGWSKLGSRGGRVRFASHHRNIALFAHLRSMVGLHCLLD